MKNGANTLLHHGNLIRSFLTVIQLIARYDSGCYYTGYWAYQSNNQWNHIVKYYHNPLIGNKTLEGLTKFFT